MAKHMEVVEFVWNSGTGPTPKVVEVFGSWDQFKEPVPTKFDGGCRFHGNIALPMPGNFYYYFNVDGVEKRETDAQFKTVITNDASSAKPVPGKSGKSKASSSHKQVQQFSDGVADSSRRLTTIKSDYNLLRVDAKRSLDTFKQSMEEDARHTVAKCADIMKHCTTIQEKYQIAVDTNRKHFDIIQKLKGNIRVYARCRPILPIDGGNQKPVVQFLPNETVAIQASNGRKMDRFEFTKTFGPETTQDTVWENVSGFIESVMNGFNCCIFAYGQTGSGKTFTMQGSKSDPGINIRALDHIFKLQKKRNDEIGYKITVNMMEIYNETIRDLLVSKQQDYKVRTKKNGSIYVENLSTHEVQSEEDVLKLMKIGAKNRSVSATKSNSESSRSHSVLTVSVSGTNPTTNAVYHGKLHLIDLAGCERVKKSGVKGAAMKEAQSINKSLSALGDVICALSKKQKHIPFRNSTLTQLLQDSLGGNSKALMFTNFSPAEAHQSETLNTLKFAQRVKSVELGQCRQNVAYSDTPKKKSKK